jgi:hypothetical protein
MSTSDITTYEGSCVCGKVRFSVGLDLREGTTLCNCQGCTKRGWWGRIVAPTSFRLQQGKEETIERSDYPGAARVFCNHCGVLVYGYGDLPEVGGPFVSINVRCLDGVDWVGSPVKYLDGKSDTWALLHETVYRDPFLAASHR